MHHVRSLAANSTSFHEVSLSGPVNRFVLPTPVLWWPFNIHRPVGQFAAHPPLIQMQNQQFEPEKKRGLLIGPFRRSEIFRSAAASHLIHFPSSAGFNVLDETAHLFGEANS